MKDCFPNEAYATYDTVPNLSYNCVKYLMTENENLWKVLKYDTPNALELPNLTLEEKRDLIYDAYHEDTLQFRVYLDTGQDDAEISRRAMLRVAPYSINAENRTIGNVHMLFELYCHYKHNMLYNNVTRLDIMLNEILKTLNGRDVEGVGRLVLSKMNSLNTGVKTYGAIPWKGYWLIMSTNV